METTKLVLSDQPSEFCATYVRETIVPQRLWDKGPKTLEKLIHSITGLDVSVTKIRKAYHVAIHAKNLDQMLYSADPVAPGRPLRPRD